MTYKKYINPGLIVRVADGTLIPEHPGNVDYQEFLVWQADGGELLPADPAFPIEPPPQ